MTWLTWRQTRAQVYAALATVVALTAVAALTHRHLVRLASGDGPIFDLLTASDRRIYYAGVIILAIAPALVGTFWGAPLVARELESGTHRLVWNQSVTRTRWLAFRLAAVVTVAAVTLGLLSWSIDWGTSLLDGAQSSESGSLPARMTPVAFSMRGLVPVGYAVLAVTVGVAAGVLVRRTVPAMAITLAVVAVVQIVTPLLARPHLAPATTAVMTFDADHLDYIRDTPGSAPPEIALTPGQPGTWILSNTTVNAAAQTATLPTWFATCLPMDGSPPVKVTRAEAGSRDPLDDCLARLNDEGYRQVVVYHPATDFWPLQWAETALNLLVASLLAAVSFWRLRSES